MGAALSKHASIFARGVFLSGTKASQRSKALTANKAFQSPIISSSHWDMYILPSDHMSPQQIAQARSKHQAPLAVIPESQKALTCLPKRFWWEGSVEESRRNMELACKIADKISGRR